MHIWIYIHTWAACSTRRIVYVQLWFYLRRYTLLIIGLTGMRLVAYRGIRSPQFYPITLSILFLSLRRGSIRHFFDSFLYPGFPLSKKPLWFSSTFLPSFPFFALNITKGMWGEELLELWSHKDTSHTTDPSSRIRFLGLLYCCSCTSLSNPRDLGACDNPQKYCTETEQATTMHKILMVHFFSLTFEFLLSVCV